MNSEPAVGNQIMGMIFHHPDMSGHSEQGRSSIHECKLLASQNSAAHSLGFLNFSLKKEIHEHDYFLVVRQCYDFHFTNK